MLDQLLRDHTSPDALLGQAGLLQHFTTAIVERALQRKLTHQLGYAKHAPEGQNTGTARTGTSPTTVTGKRGQRDSAVPRDRNGEFEPQLIQQGQTRFDGLDENMISLYARGMTTREIQGHLEALDGVEVSPSLISTVTDAVMEDVRAWQNQPLDAVDPILSVDAIQVNVRTHSRVINTPAPWRLGSRWRA